MGLEDFSNTKTDSDSNYEPVDIETTLKELPDEIKSIIPSTDEDLDYFRNTNEMHTSLDKVGGSKFVGVENIFAVLKMDAERISKAIQERTDDREELLKMGADESSFLPDIKTEDMPEGLPEALYYKIDGVEGKLGIIKLNELDPDTKVLIQREKSSKDEEGNERVPCSFTVIQGTFDDLPDTDFATAIVGREGEGDELWTIHPGAPIKTAQGDVVPGSEKMRAPSELTEGEQQEAMVTTVGELIESGHMNEDDYVKIIPGDVDETIAQYNLVSN
jgi:hypothetical protein